MMFGYSDEWWAVLFVPALLWVPFGPFLMGATGWWCAHRPGLWPRLWSWLLPAVPVGVMTTNALLPWESVSRAGWLDDFLGFLGVYVGAITLLPWLLGYGITRLTRALRARRAGHDGGPAKEAA